MGKTLSNTVYYSISVYVEFFIGLIISVLIARHLSPNEYGHYSYYIWICTLLIILINGGMPTALIKFTAELSQSGNDGSLSFVYKKINQMYVITAAIVIIGFVAVFTYQYTDSVDGEIYIYFLLAVAVLFKSKYMQYVGYYKGMEKFNILAHIVLIISPINLLVIMVISFLFSDIQYYIFAYLCISILYFVVARMKTRKNKIHAEVLKGHDNKELNSRLYRHYIIATILGFLNFIVFKQSEIFFLKLFHDESVLAFFNVGFLLGTSAAMLVPGIYAGLLLPIMSRLYNKESDVIELAYLNSLRYLIILGIPLIVITLLISKKLVVVLYGTAYEQSYIALIGCIIAATIQTISGAATSLMTGTDRQNVLLKILLIGGALKLFIDYMLIKQFDYYGAIAAYLLSSIIVSIMYIWYVKKHYKIVHQNVIYAKVLFVSVLSGVIPAFILILNTNPVFILAALAIYATTYIYIIANTNCMRLQEKARIRALVMKIKNKLMPIK